MKDHSSGSAARSVKKQPSSLFSAERRMYPVLRRFLESTGLKVYYEFRTMQGKPDVVGFQFVSRGAGERRTYERAIFVEAKLVDWKKAVRQARSHSSYASQTYVAIPEDRIHRVDCNYLRRFGIGLLSVGIKQVRVVLPSLTREIQDNWHRDQIERKLSQEPIPRRLRQCVPTGAWIKPISSSAAASMTASACSK